MSNEFFTLIVVPHAKARFRKIQVPIRLAKRVAVVGALAALAVLGLLLHYASVASEVQDLRQLKAENVTLRTKTQQYEANAERLHAKVQALEKMVNKLGVMAGVEHPLVDTDLSGVGGVSAGETVSPSAESRAFVQTMDRELSRLSEKSAQLEAFYRDRQVLLASTPSIWPVTGYLSSNFGQRKDPFTGLPDSHPGIDISAPTGTPIKSPADGVVVVAGRRGGYGNAIIIDHGFGIITRYGHLSKFDVKPGQRIHRGDRIGFVGSTGKSVAPHLHYEVWVNDEMRNPIHYILDAYRSFG